MKKIIFALLIITVMASAGCTMLKKTNAPEANRKSDNAVPKENTQDVVIEMEEN